jgi:hypothetical protein
LSAGKEAEAKGLSGDANVAVRARAPKEIFCWHWQFCAALQKRCKHIAGEAFPLLLHKHTSMLHAVY